MGRWLPVIAVVLCAGLAGAMDGPLQAAVSPDYRLSFDDDSGWEPLGDAHLAEPGKYGRALDLRGNAGATVAAPPWLSARQGSLSLWVKPFWDADGAESHTFLTLGWDHPRRSYLALSYGWWEPTGAGELYFVVSNQEAVHCHAPVDWRAGEWRLVTAVWQAGDEGYCRLFVDGDPIAKRNVSFVGDYTPRSALHLGDDRVTTVSRGRRAQALIDELRLFRRPMSALDAYLDYQAGETIAEERARPKWGWLDKALNVHRQWNASYDGNSRLVERRVMFDGAHTWALSRGHIDERLRRMKDMGINIYVPCVICAGARYPTAYVPPDPRLGKNPFAGGFDPLAYLVEKAATMGIEVHPWFLVVKRIEGVRPEFSGDGVPPGAYDVHDPAFRAYAAQVVLDVARRYAVDGINLDYIRSMGVCTSPSCRASYRSRYGRDLTSDLSSGASGTSDRIAAWNGDAVTDIVRRVRQGLSGLDRPLALSVDTVPLSHSKIYQGQDSVAWANNGLVDVIYDMNYGRHWDLDRVIRTRQALDDPGKLTVILDVYSAYRKDNGAWLILPRDPDVLADGIKVLRRVLDGSNGVAFYHWQQVTEGQSSRLRAAVFDSPARAP